MVGVINPSIADDEDDRRSTSTVASTVGTGNISLSLRMHALSFDFGDKLHDEGSRGGGINLDGLGDVEQSILEVEPEQEEDGDTRSEPGTVNTLVTGGDDQDFLGELVGDLQDVDRPRSGRRSLLGNSNSPDSPDHPFSFHRFPFQICRRLFRLRGNAHLKRLTISQVEELKQHGYVVVDDFVSKDLAHQVKNVALMQHIKGRMAEAPKPSGDSAGTRTGDSGGARTGLQSGDLIMPLLIGKPPADSSPLALFMVAFQELYDDLQEVMKFRKTAGEYQLSLQLPGSSGQPRHRDALPDNGRKHGRRRVTCMICCNAPDTTEKLEPCDTLSIWPPRSMPQSMIGVGPSRHIAGVASRRSLTGSECDTTSVTESDTCSIRSHIGAGYMAGSMTSSMWAEAASALEPYRPGDDTISVDNMSMSESVDGAYAAAAAAASASGLQSGTLHSLHAAGATAGMPGSAAALAVAEARAMAWSAALSSYQTQPMPAGGGHIPPGPVGEEQPAGIEWVEQDGEMVLEVSPLPGRLILFLSGAVDHAHRPVGPSSELVSVTAWYQ